MPIRMKAIREGKGAEIALSGVVTAKEIMDASYEIYDVLPLESQQFQLWDYTDVTELDATDKEIGEIAWVDRARADYRTSPLYVLSVQPTDLGFGLAAMYGVFSDHPNWITVRFRSRDEADSWLDAHL
jgi:hypothetical protein